MSARKDKRLRALLRNLRDLDFELEEKQDPNELLTDFLEVIAVSAGEKPAHLQGQGMRSGTLIDGMETVARNRGLQVMRTHELIPFHQRPPDYDPAFFAWQRVRSAAA